MGKSNVGSIIVILDSEVEDEVIEGVNEALSEVAEEFDLALDITMPVDVGGDADDEDEGDEDAEDDDEGDDESDEDTDDDLYTEAELAELSANELKAILEDWEVDVPSGRGNQRLIDAILEAQEGGDEDEESDEEGDDDEDEEISEEALNDMELPELKELAKEYEIPLRGKVTKAGLVKKILAAAEEDDE